MLNAFEINDVPQTDEGSHGDGRWIQRLWALVGDGVWRTFGASNVLLPFAASLIVVLAGISLSIEFVKPPAGLMATTKDPAARRNIVSAMLSWDGARYEKIATEGYVKSDVRRAASFAGYPFVARAVSVALFCTHDVALLITSNLAFLLACACAYRYVLISRPGASPVKIARLTVLLLCFCPLAVFFHVGFSESLFLAAALIAFYGMERGWPAPAIGFIIGLATGTRLVGVGLVLAFADHLVRSGNLRNRFLSSAVGVVLSCWGLVGFMALQASVYGDPLMFVTAQGQFVTRTDLPAEEVAWRLVTLQPIWSVFNPSSNSYWESWDSSENPVFNLRFFNPLIFFAFCTIVGIGYWKGTIRRGEALFSLVVLGLPYVTHGLQAGMLSQARYASVAFPAYIAAAAMFRRMPGSMLVSVACVGAVLLFAFAALFGASYAVY